MLAVIKTGGKQYLVSPGKKIKIEKIEGDEGKEVTFSDVLLVENGEKVAIGQPAIPNATVSATILKQGKSEKVIAFKYKAKKRYHRKKGHRQLFTEVEIKSIDSK
ncbi:MAG TPA: 50S ribosomal protein L21 [Candidatus Paceibacterota bacterium]|nr:50S ribosomal protein L21 [Candidatus Pacearchaeota archaeon]HRZ50592.1 50S ribosomal protein L21 [Candidatus Paceibacterota bacterium]HSA36313.1 50S ribosomal protein L21 [Candidatus Paceibacterota bacterium]